MVGLQNKNKYLLIKLDKQKIEFEKGFTEIKVELDNANQTIQDLKAQATILDGQKFKQVEDELQTIIATNKVLCDDNLKLLLLIKGFKKSLVEQVGDRMVTLSHLHLLKE